MDDAIRQRLTDVQAKYSDALMTKANVIGVGLGYAQVDGELTDIPAIVVLVEVKVPVNVLQAEDVVPRELEEMRVDVQETGALNAF